MSFAGNPRLSPAAASPTMARRASFALAIALIVIGECAFAQAEPNAKRDDLDVTMQIIVDPDAKLPDEVVRRIALPPRKAAEQPAQGRREPDKPDAASKGQERAQEAQELGREASENARERTQEAAELREQARRAKAEEHQREHGPPPDPPGRPPRN
jgi:hypothetical protein